MHTIDLVIFLVITGAIVILGASFYWRQSSSDEYTAAGHSLSGWTVGMSIFATYVSSISFLSYPGKSFDSNWNAFVFSLSVPIALFFAAKYFVPFYRRQTSVSAYTFLEQRFGLWARWYVAVCYLLTQVARIGSIMFLLALSTNVLLGWDMHWVIIFTSAAIIFYTMMGGIRGVIWTEAIQGVIIIVGALLCLGVLWATIPGGGSHAIDVAVADGKFSLGSFDMSLGESTFWVCLVYGVFTNLQNFGIDQNYVQRYHTTKSEGAARFSVILSGLLYIPVSAAFFLIGTMLYSYNQAAPGFMPDTVGGDYVFPYYIANGLPIGITGVLLASIFAAGMSTVATSVTSASTVLQTDFFKRLRPWADDYEQLIVLKYSSVIVGLLGVFVSLALLNVTSILDAWWKVSSLFSGGMLGLFLLGFLSKRASNVDAAVGVVCGFIVIVWISVAQWAGLPETGIHEYLAIVFGTMVIFLVGFLMAKFYANRKSHAKA